MAEDKLLPVTVVGGYLGAGKTTLVNDLLTQARGLRAAVLVNDFGEINIDASLIVSHDGDTISLSNGCMCCSMTDGFAAALGQILKQSGRLDHIVVEASGVANPAKIAQTAQAFGLPLDGILVVADAEQVRSQAANKYAGDTVQRQLAQADLIVVNKTDLVSTEAVAKLRPWIAEHAPAAPIFETSYASVPLAVLLGNAVHPSCAAKSGLASGGAYSFGSSRFRSHFRHHGGAPGDAFGCRRLRRRH
jgi:G3E family GTPase